MKACFPIARSSVVCFALVIGIWSCCGTFLSIAAENDSNAKAFRKNNNPKKSGELYVPLVPKPTDPSYSGEAPVQPATIFLEPVVDNRDNKAQIGQNIETGTLSVTNPTLTPALIKSRIGAISR